MGTTKTRPLFAAFLAGLAVTGCQTTDISANLPDSSVYTLEARAHARYDRIQPEVDAYYRCGEKQAYGMATTVLRPRDIATAAKSACGRKRNQMLWRMQKCYPSPIWTKVTLDIEQTFRERTIARVFDRRDYLRAHGEL